MSSSVCLSVVVPSYRRPDDLRRCLDALSRQTASHFVVLVVARTDDHPTLRTIEAARGSTLEVRHIPVIEPGLIAALNAGKNAAASEFVAFTDDDAEPPSAWVARILQAFARDHRLGAVGGPDELWQHGKLLFSGLPPTNRIGRTSWYGRIYGNHHRIPCRERLRVDVLKGVNMAYRRDLIAATEIGQGLKGIGSQPGNEYSLAAAVRARGFKIEFHRVLQTRHHIAPRPQEDTRNQFNGPGAEVLAFNSGFVLGAYETPWRIPVVRIFGLLIGSTNIPGILLGLLKPGVRRSQRNFRRWAREGFRAGRTHRP